MISTNSNSLLTLKTNGDTKGTYQSVTKMIIYNLQQKRPGASMKGKDACILSCGMHTDS